MASEALNWALANGMTQAEFDQRIFNAVLNAQQDKTSNAMLRIEMDRLGISPEDVARATGVTTQSVASQYATATPTTQAELIAAAAAANELAARTARDTTASQALIDARNLAATTATSKLPASQQTAITTGTQNLVTTQNEAALALQQRNAVAAAAEAARLAALRAGTTGTTTGGLLAPTGATSVTGTTPFANATQGFEQNFRNYTSIPIGAQYNPNVVGGTGSPYSQVMGQMKPVGNPYANVVAGQAMGGYNPGLYDQINAANIQKAIAANAGTTLADYYSAGDSGGDGGGGGGGGGGGTGAGAGTGNAMAKGGYVHGGLMFGPNPPGPDDGAVNLDLGEYVIKKSSVNQYGRGLLDMINEGKVSAKKMKSLLG
jgi:hypothetical protein